MQESIPCLCLLPCLASMVFTQFSASAENKAWVSLSVKEARALLGNSCPFVGVHKEDKIRGRGSYSGITASYQSLKASGVIEVTWKHVVPSDRNTHQD